MPALSPHFPGFHDMPPVFATAFMVGFMEWACAEALRPYLDPGEQTVGVRVEVSHCAATPVGMNVTALVRLVEVDGRRLRFAVACRDELDIVGEGFHERVVVNKDAFIARVAAKSCLCAHEERPIAA